MHDAQLSPAMPRLSFILRGFALATVGLAFVLESSILWGQSAPTVLFNRDIRPIMADSCFKCHGRAKQEAGLRLDLREAALAPTASGITAIVPGDPNGSEMVRRVIATDENEVMPPADSGKVLTAEQKDLLKRWVEQGALYQQHWSFEPPVAAAIPIQPGGPYRVTTAIDAFIAERLAQEGLAMSAEADRETLIRRAALALNGLSPAPADIDAYLADTSPQAYERMVERYLASPRFGEEMARSWLDVARYGDTHGLHLDNERQMWAYRDWVIASINQNKPFDQFTIEQIAGDLLPSATLEQQVATGFLRCNVSTGEGGSIEDEWVFRNAVDRTNTVAETWMGLTAGCAVCHDHKFDPLTAKDYYSLYAFFYSAADPALDGNALLTNPTLKLVRPDDQRRLAEFDARLAELASQIDQQAAATPYTDPATLQPPPAAETFEQVWFDDDFPAGSRVSASPGHPTTLVKATEGHVHSGEVALRRTDPGLAQDVFENIPPLEIPADGKLFAHVWIEGNNPPRSVMLQYFKGGWLHRAVWGDYQAIDWGQPGTTERVDMGPLPESDRFVRLEVEASRVGLQAGDQVTGFALTQFGGTVFWDQVGVAGRSDPAADPRRSFLAWWKQATGHDKPELPPELAAILKAGPEPRPPAEHEQKLLAYYVRNICLDTRPLFEPIVKQMDALRQARDSFDQSIPSTFVFRDLGQPRTSHVMVRGQYNQPGEQVDPGVPAILPPLVNDVPGSRADRLDLARWLVAKEHPLTARVAVNRIWQQLFGIGLVKTSFDFGTQGEPPSHPELLDWLAVWFQQHDWDVKGLVRLIVHSAAFRQSSQMTPELLERDPDNRLYARGPRFRMDAEQIRDNALFVSGLLNTAMGGRGVNPYQPPNIWEPVGFVGSNTSVYAQDHGPALYRRSIYTFLKRTAPPPFMANFDGPSRESFCARRERSNTPLQALQLLNDVQHFEAARALATRLLLEGGATADERITYGYRLAVGRRPDADELTVMAATLATLRQRYVERPEAAAQAVRNGESLPRAGLDEPELAAYTLLANLFLNLDEALTRN